MECVSKADNVYDELCLRVERCALEPGSTYSESALGSLLGVGRTPLREAVQRLSHDGLLISAAGAGMRVPDLSVDEQIARLEVRRATESLAAALAAGRLPDAMVDDLTGLSVGIQGQTDLDAYMEAVARSNQLIGEASQNAYLQRMMTPLHVLSRRFWRATISEDREALRQGSKYHGEILKAVLARDENAACDAVIQLNDYLLQEAVDVAQSRAEAVSRGPWILDLPGR